MVNLLVNEPELNSYKKWCYFYSHIDSGAMEKFIALVYRYFCTPMTISGLLKIAQKRSNLKILEAGCGSGIMSAYLARKNKTTLLDFSPDALKIAKRNFMQNRTLGEFIRGNILDIPFLDNSFDIVWNQGVLEHFKDPAPAMKEMMRVTKKGGYVVIFIPVFLSPLHFVYLLLRLLHLMRFWPFDYQYFFTAGEFKLFMEGAGYKNIIVKKLWLKTIGFSQVGYCQKY